VKLPHRRVDRGWLFPEMVLGCVFLSWGMIQTWPSGDPELGDMSPQWQAWATLMLLIGSLLCVLGVITGTVWTMRESRLAGLYAVGFAALGFGVGSYAVAATINASSVWVPLSGLAVFLTAGAVRALFDLGMMIRDRRRSGRDNHA
jgi:hypothetical protein